MTVLQMLNDYIFL